jgi:hypothetical protein
MSIGKESWGPYAWHLLHRVAIHDRSPINDNDKYYYYIFYSTFLYCLPCSICKEHYDNILVYFNKLDKDRLDREYLIEWINITHNEVNDILSKPQFDIDNSIKNHSVTDNNKIFYFIEGVFFHLDNNIAIFDFDQIYNFFISFCHLYPDSRIREFLINKIKEDAFINISLPLELKRWFSNVMESIHQLKILI